MVSRTLELYKQAYQGLSPSTWLLSLIMLINRSGTMVIPFMTIYLTSPEMGYSIGDAGIVLGMFGAGAVLGGYSGGWLTDRVGFFSVQLFALLGGGMLFMVLGNLKSFPLICSFTFLLSLVNEAFRPANSTAIAYYSSEKNRTRSYSLNRLAINLGWAVGGALGGLIASYSYQLLFIFDGITNISAAVLLWFLLRKPGKAAKKEFTKEQRSHVDSAYKDTSYIWFVILTAMFAACFFQLFSTLTAYFRNELDFSTQYIGMLMAVNGLVITFIEMVLVFKLEGRRRSTFYITAGVFLCGISYLFLALAPMDKILAIVLILGITFSEILSMPFMNSYWISRSSPGNRGQYAGLYTMAWSLAHTTGPLFGSLIAEHFGFTTLWTVVSIIAIITALGFLLLHYRGKTKAGS